jgi:nucleotide-binding universal stress UspA family protein
MKTLITATDFSKASLNAVNYAADMAAAINARLEILHVMQVPVITDIPDYVVQLEKDMYQERGHKLQVLQLKLQKRTANRVKITWNIMEGDTNNAIKEEAKNKKPLAIILGSKGAGSLQNMLFGSVALHTAKHAQFPVLLIPEKAKFTNVSAIVFATDLLAENWNVLLAELRRWLRLFDVKLEVVYVNNDSTFRVEKEKQFASFKKHLSRYDVHFNYVENDSVPDGIAAYVKTKKPGMLALMYHKERFFHRLVYRSEFGNIFKNTAVPLLVIQG